MMIGLFKTYSSNDHKTNLESVDYVAFSIVKSIDTQIQFITSDINKIESKKDKTNDENIIRVFQQFQQVNNTIPNSNYLNRNRDSLLDLVNKYWNIEKNQETENENNEPQKTNESYKTQDSSKADASSNISSRKMTMSSNSSQETTSSNLISIYGTDVDAKTCEDKYITFLAYIIKNSAPNMIKNIR